MDGKERKKTWAPIYDLKETTNYWIFEKDMMDGSLCRICCGRGYGLVARQAML